MNNNEKQENNAETGTNNVYRKDADNQRPEEAGNKGSELTPTSDKGDLGKQTNMERTSFQDKEGYFRYRCQKWLVKRSESLDGIEFEKS